MLVPLSRASLLSGEQGEAEQKTDLSSVGLAPCWQPLFSGAARPPSSPPTQTTASDACLPRALQRVGTATTASSGGHSGPGMGKIQRVQDEIGEVTDMMRANIEAVVDRGEHLELLVDKSDALGSQASQFQKQSVGLRKAMWWQNMKMVFMLAFVVLFVLLMILFSVCGWTFSECRAKH